MVKKERGPAHRLTRLALPLALVALGGVVIVLGLNRPSNRPAVDSFSPTPPVTGEPLTRLHLSATPLPQQLLPAVDLTPTGPPPSPTASLIPTVPPPVVDTPRPALTPPLIMIPTLSPAASPTVVPVETAVPAAEPAVTGPIGAEDRFGVAVPAGYLADAAAAGLRFGSYLTWAISPSNQGNFWQIVRLSEDGVKQSWAEIEQVIAARPGAIWLVGNEPDAPLQDNVTPERYAALYHAVYEFIKMRDPQARIAIGGVSQPTPLRLAYLERVLAGYRVLYGEPLPVDIWNVHAFILREEEGSWGAGIPPGMSGAVGQLIEIDDHDDLDRFEQQLIDFRVWMAAQGYQDRPLVISEYGILMPPEYGFDQHRVARFLEGTLDFFTTARHEAGYPADDYRLVQWWFWYGVYDPPHGFPAGNLYDPQSGRLTPSGELFSRYPRQ